MRKIEKRLRLNRETLRTLDCEELRKAQIAGGSPYTEPPSEWCMTTIRCTVWCPVLTE